MKKLIAIMVVFALVAGSAFAADVYFGAWGTASFIPLNVQTHGDGSDTEIFTGTGAYWGGDPNLALFFEIKGDHIGFQANVDFGGSTANRDGVAYTYWKPNDLFQLDIGWSRWQVLRGIDSVESFAYFGGGAPDALFNRFSTADWWGKNPGAIVRVTPIENLYVGAAFMTGSNNGEAGDGGWYQDDWGGWYEKPDNTLQTILKQGQYAAGYNLPGIGLIRAGYFGTSNGSYGTGDDKLLQVAFNVTAVNGLALDIGLTYSADSDRSDAKLNVISAAAYGGYDLGLINLGFWLNGAFGGENDNTKLSIGVNPVFVLDFADIGIGAYVDAELADDVSLGLGFSAYLQKAYGGGTFKTGLSTKITGGDKKDILLQVPFEIVYSIW